MKGSTSKDDCRIVPGSHKAKCEKDIYIRTKSNGEHGEIETPYNSIAPFVQLGRGLYNEKKFFIDDKVPVLERSESLLK